MVLGRDVVRQLVLIFWEGTRKEMGTMDTASGAGSREGIFNRSR